MQTKKIAIMGMGVVGGGTAEILIANREYIKNTQGIDIEIKAVLDRSPKKLAAHGLSESLFCDSIDKIVADHEIDLVVETMGGVEPAFTYICRLLAAGKSVVTANKELLAKRRYDLEPIAKAHGCGLFFEASCVGGVPIIRALGESIQGDRVNSIYGIINGTTNYILTKMSGEGISYEQALKQAQSLGFAEADPTADVEGYDAAYKLSILASLAFRTEVPYERIHREGISGITAEDIKNAHALGYEIKLIAIGKRNGNGVEVRVHPLFVPEGHALASVGGAFNAVYLNGDSVGDLMFYGAGAGARPTGSAIVSDIVKGLTSPPKYVFERGGEGNISDDFVSGYYACMTVQDKPGVLASIATILSEDGVSIRSALQREAETGTSTLLILTHNATESAARHALGRIDSLDSVVRIESVIRVM